MQNYGNFYLACKKEQLYDGTFEERATVLLDKGTGDLIAYIS